MREAAEAGRLTEAAKTTAAERAVAADRTAEAMRCVWGGEHEVWEWGVSVRGMARLEVAADRTARQRRQTEAMG